MNSKILIVEDEAIISEGLKYNLINSGYANVNTVQSGEECMSFLQENPTDLILMDVKLSGDMNGIQASLLIKAMYEIPVIFITSFSDWNLVNQLKKTEPYGYLVKPIDPFQLISNVDIALYRSRVDRQLADNRKTMEVLLNSSEDFICLMDRKGIIMEANEKLAVHFGKSRADIIGTSMYEFNAPESGRLRKEVKQILKTCKNILYEESADIKTQEYRLFSILDKNDTVMKIAIFIRDITELRTMEKEYLNTVNIERKRIGQDLHDGLGQKLTGLSYLMQALSMSVSDDKTEKSKTLESLKEMTGIVSDLIYQTRQLSKGLNPLNLDNLDLISALQELAEETEKIFKVRCSVIQKGIFFNNDMEILTNVYYIIRESVNNSIKHGNPDEIIITVHADDKNFKIEVLDTGKIKVKKSLLSQGIGLKIMKYRAHVIGANFSAEMGDKGFVVTIAKSGENQAVNQPLREIPITD